MVNTKFNAKSFNPEAFKYSVDRIPNLKTNEFKKSRALAPNADIASVLGSQNGTEYARIAIKGLLDGEAVNYDGETDITATSTKTFERGVVVVGRAKAWTEKDFSYDVTGGVDFMDNVAAQVSEYKEELDQNTILAVLEGIFAMTGTKNAEFVNKHTSDISTTGTGVMSATTLNSATNKACGANKKKFTMVFMHSDVATGLENLQLIEYLKYTDANGIQRNIELAQWGNKLVVVDDEMPVADGYYAATSTDAGALHVVASGASTGEINLADVKKGAFYPSAVAANDYVIEGVQYTTYVLGDGAIDYEDVGAKVPYEMHRDPKTNGGEDTLYMRQRKVFAPKGISYEKASQATLSPTNAELKNGANWTLVHTGEQTANQRTYINHKSIPIARIISRG